MKFIWLGLVALLVSSSAASAQPAPCHLEYMPSGGYTLVCPAPFVEPHERLFHLAIVAAGAVQFAEKLETTYALACGYGGEMNPAIAPFANRPAVFGLTTGIILTASTIVAVKYHASPNRALRWFARAIVVEEGALGTYALVRNAKYVRGGACR